MPGIDDMINKMQKVKFEKILSASFKATKKELEELQIGQMMFGKKADGKKIGRYKNRRYAQEKYAMNPLAGFGNIDLRKEANFHNGVFVKVERLSLIFGSRDEKSADLEKRYDPFGLNKESRQTYSQKILPGHFIKNFKRELSGL